MVEQKMPVRDHAFEHADGVDHWSDGAPGDVALDSGGPVVAVFVGGGLVLVAEDQVPPGLAVGVGFEVGAAAVPQAQNYWWKVLIPAMRYSSPETRT